MDLIIAFLIAVGFLVSDAQIANFTMKDVDQEHYELLVNEFGEEYIRIIGTDDNEY